MVENPGFILTENYPYENMDDSEIDNLPIETLVENINKTMIEVLYITGPDGILYKKDIVKIIKK
jgi:hypothetical protein